MEKLKQWVALTVVACLAILAAGWFVLVSPKRGEAADLRQQASDQETANGRLRTELEVLKAQAKELPGEQAKLAAVAAKIPDNPALPGLVRALLGAAESSGVELVSVAPGQPEVVAPPAPAAPAAPAAGQTAGTTPAAPAAQATPAAAGAAGAAPGPAGQLAKIGLSLNVVGNYFEVQRFLSELEELPRALRVHTLNLTPGVSPTDTDEASTAAEDGSSLTTTINGYVFMAANRPVPTAATVPGAAGAPTDAAANAAPSATSAQ